MNETGRFNMSSVLRKPPLNDSYVKRSKEITEILDYTCSLDSGVC